MSPSNPDFQVQVSFSETLAPEWADEQEMRCWVVNALPPDMTAGEVDIRVCDEQEMRRVQQQFAGKDYATNVLAFPAELESNVPVNLLGDVLICAPVVDSEARQQNKSRRQHLAHLLTHGVLHLLGFDHQTDEEAEVMEARETVLLERLGFPDPYTPAAP